MPTKMTAEVVRITRALGKSWLKKSVNIRDKNLGKIRCMVQDAKTDNWEDNGESVKWMDDPNNPGEEILVDGQNRLHAIVESGIPQYLVVVRHITDSKYIDIGEKRTVPQLLRSEGIPYPGQIAAAVANLIQYDHYLADPTTTQKYRASHSERIATYRKYSKQLNKVVPKIHNTKKLLWRATLAAVMVKGTVPKDYPAAKQEFLECISTGLNGDESLASNDACYALRELMIDESRKKFWRPLRSKLGLTIKAWNFHRSEMLMNSTKLRFVETGPTAEKFPKAL